jgi:hypothetical protein
MAEIPGKTRLGPNQLRLLRAVGITAAVVVPDKETRRLCDLGMMASEPDGSFAHITPAGLRALATAAEAGRIDLFKMREPRAAISQGDEERDG